MKYDFDKIIDRENTHCIKLDFREKLYGNNNVLPLWVADMDFEIAHEIQGAIIERTRHGIFGYTHHYDSLKNSVSKWMAEQHNWQFGIDSVLMFHGVVPSINLMLHAFTEKGDKIIVQPPVYYPFYDTIENNGREVIHNCLKMENGNYVMDFEDLERQIDEKTKALILCHPHNPAGRVWNRTELETLDKICQKHNILVISDEIHCDIVFEGHKHIPYATISDYAKNNTITCVAPSKTFNIAGLALSAVVSENHEYIKALGKLIFQWQLHGANLLGMTAFEAAYNKGLPWLKELMVYLTKNLDYLENFFANELPQIKLIKPQATYLAWLDCSNLGFNDNELKKFLVEKANLGLSHGPTFGKGGEGFERLNFASPKSIIEKGLLSLKKAVDEL